MLIRWHPANLRSRAAAYGAGGIRPPARRERPRGRGHCLFLLNYNSQHARKGRERREREIEREIERTEHRHKNISPPLDGS